LKLSDFVIPDLVFVPEEYFVIVHRKVVFVLKNLVIFKMMIKIEDFSGDFIVIDKLGHVISTFV